MAKNLERYCKAWYLRAQGKTLKEIGIVMGYSTERARIVVNYVNFTLQRRKKEYKNFKEIIARLRKSS